MQVRMLTIVSWFVFVASQALADCVGDACDADIDRVEMLQRQKLTVPASSWQEDLGSLGTDEKATASVHISRYGRTNNLTDELTGYEQPHYATPVPWEYIKDNCPKVQMYAHNWIDSKKKMLKVKDWGPGDQVQCLESDSVGPRETWYVAKFVDPLYQFLTCSSSVADGDYVAFVSQETHMYLRSGGKTVDAHETRSTLFGTVWMTSCSGCESCLSCDSVGLSLPLRNNKLVHLVCDPIQAKVSVHDETQWSIAGI